jgi:heptosyltransferase-2
MNRLVILAPNWLGDAVMALPAVRDVRQAAPHARITVAARPSIAPLFRIVSDIDDVIVMERRSWREIGSELRGRGFDTALLLPNSMHAALASFGAGVPERWGYDTQLRGALLTRRIAPPSGLHQVEYYQQLVHALGFPSGPIEPSIAVPSAVRDIGARTLQQAGWDRSAALTALAPGAAYGGAKRWPPQYFAELAGRLARGRVQCVMIGAPADAATAEEVARIYNDEARAFQNRENGGPRTAARHSSSGSRPIVPLLSLVGQTDLPTLAGVLANCRALVTNDSGAMHLGAAVGVRVTAVFGPTNERATRPLGDAHTVITNPVWCRPCMLRECPLDHRCMLGIDASTVAAAAQRSL